MDLSALTEVDAESLTISNDNQPNESRDSQPLKEAPLQPEQIPTIDDIINTNTDTNTDINTETNTTTTNTSIDIPIQPEPPQEPISESIPQQEEEKKQSIEKSITESKNEFIDISYDDDNNKEADIDDIIDINLPIVDSLQPDELCLSIQDTINKMCEYDPIKHSNLILQYKDNLIQQLEKLENISAAINSLNDMQSTAEKLPKNEKTGYPNINAIDLALREHTFFAEQINSFGMLLIEICDVNKIKDKYSSQHSKILLKKMCETISSEFIYQHLLFHYSVNRLVLLVYIENEKELMICGKEIIRLLTSHSYDIKDEILHSTISVGAAIYENDNNKSDSKEEPFDFRTWLKNAELGLNKANNSGQKNQCFISRENDIISAIIPSMNSENSKSNHKQHTKSTLSLLARSRDRTHSTGANSYNKLTLNDMTQKLTPQQIRASIRLYDKLMRLDTKNNNNNNKLIALSLCTRLKEDGANLNFQHPNYNGNSILMLCCNNNINIIIKYFCIKLYQEINFSLINNDGNNALMCAILNKDLNDEIVKLIASKTTDKLLMNHEGQTAVQLAQKMNRNDLLPLLQ